MTPVEKRNINRLLIEYLKKADFVTIVCICCVIDAKQYKRELEEQLQWK